MDRIRFSRARIQNVRTFANNVDRAVRLNHEINAIATPRIERNILRDNINPLESYDDLKFRQNFAFSKATFLLVFDVFKDQLATRESPEDGYYLSPMLRLLIFLQYLRSNSFYRCVSTQRIVNIPTSSVERIVNSVAKVIASKTSTYVKFPDLNEQDQIASRVFEKTKIPGNSSIKFNSEILTTQLILQ